MAVPIFTTLPNSSVPPPLCPVNTDVSATLEADVHHFSAWLTKLNNSSTMRRSLGMSPQTVVNTGSLCVRPAAAFVCV